MAKKYDDENIAYLYDAILTLKTREECYAFFDDLCTVSEIKEMSKRLLVAKRLSDKDVYNDIAKETGLSTATISRVNHCIKYGDGGYATVLSRMKEKNKEEK